MCSIACVSLLAPDTHPLLLDIYQSGAHTEPESIFSWLCFNALDAIDPHQSYFVSPGDEYTVHGRRTPTQLTVLLVLDGPPAAPEWLHAAFLRAHDLYSRATCDPFADPRWCVRRWRCCLNMGVIESLSLSPRPHLESTDPSSPLLSRLPSQSPPG